MICWNRPLVCHKCAHLGLSKLTTKCGSNAVTSPTLISRCRAEPEKATEIELRCAEQKAITILFPERQF